MMIKLVAADNWLITSHIAGVHNTVADVESRKSHNDHLKWALDRNMCVTITQELKCQPMVDIFSFYVARGM